MELNIFVDSADERSIWRQLWIRLFSERFISSADQNNLFKAAGVGRIIRRLPNHRTPESLADALQSCLDERVADSEPDYQPAVLLARYLLQNEQLESAESDLCEILDERGQQQFPAIKARRSVGCIEHTDNRKPNDRADRTKAIIGSGVLVAPQLLLTCDRVFAALPEHTSARVGFRYYEAGKLPILSFSLAYQSQAARCDAELDYALVSLDKAPNCASITPEQALLSPGARIYLIHHPSGQPARVAEGTVHSRTDTAIYCSYATDPPAPGSAGGPIFDEHWRFVAFHRGDDTIDGKAPAQQFVGVPLTAFWPILAAELPNT